MTGGPRRIDFFRTGVGAVDDTGSIISFTHDLRKKQVDIDTHPIANLLDFQDDAREVIFEKSNGLHGYAMYSGAGKRQDEVPFDIANDRTIPSPFPPRLQTSSCISCHETDGSDGWKPVSNDVKKMVGLGKKLNIFGDFGSKNPFAGDVLDRLVGLYNGEPERALQRGRDDYARVMLSVTGPWPGSAEKGHTNIVKLATNHVMGRYLRHTYGLVTPEIALKDLGVQLLPEPGDKDDKEKPAEREARALKLLNELLPPDQRGLQPLPEPGHHDGQVIAPEDPRLAGLKAGIGINRTDWDLAFAFGAERAQQTLRFLARQKGK